MHYIYVGFFFVVLYSTYEAVYIYFSLYSLKTLHQIKKKKNKSLNDRFSSEIVFHILYTFTIVI